MTPDLPDFVSCDNCDVEIPRSATRCPECGVTIVTLDRALIVLAIGVLLIPVGLWGVYQLRESVADYSTVWLLGIALSIVLPLFVLYSGARLLRHRKKTLEP